VFKQNFQCTSIAYPTIIFIFYLLRKEQDIKKITILILINVRLLEASGFYGSVLVNVNIIPFLSTSSLFSFCSILTYLFQSTVRFQLSDSMEYNSQ